MVMCLASFCYIISSAFLRKLLTLPFFLRHQAKCWKMQPKWPSSLLSTHLVNWLTAFYFQIPPKQYSKGLQKHSEHSSLESSLLFFTWRFTPSVTFSSPAEVTINGPSMGRYKARVYAYSSLHSCWCFLATTSCAEPHDVGYDGCTRTQWGTNPTQWDRQGKGGKRNTEPKWGELPETTT